MMIIGVLVGLVLLAFLAVAITAVVRGQPISDPSLHSPDSPHSHGPFFCGPEYSGSKVTCLAAQGLVGRPADWIHPVEAADIVLRGERERERRIGD